MGINKQQVWDAADELSAAGERPSAKRVRALLGTGSLSTIQTALATWPGASMSSTSVQGDPLPSAVERCMRELGSKVWAEARTAGEERMAIEREALASVRDAMRAEQQEMAELVDSIECELEAERARFGELERVAEQGRIELATVHTRLTMVDTRNGELERQIECLRDEGQGLQRVAIEAQERAAEMVGRVQALEAQNTALLSRLSPNASLTPVRP